MVTLHPITPADKDFLYRVYASSREDEMALVDWPEAQKEAFLHMQFEAQHGYYAAHFDGAEFALVQLNGDPIGRLYLDRRKDEIRIIDIALLTAYRRQGIGSQLLKEVLAEGQAAGLPVRIHVERYNPAMHLYQRLGFQQIGDEGVYYLMEWSPNSPGHGGSRDFKALSLSEA